MSKRFYKILSIALLLLFVTNLLHDFVPHSHHVHGSISSSALNKNDHHDHNEGHHHHHHHSDKDEGDQEHNEFSIFDLLFANHSHIKHDHQDVPKIVEHSKKFKHVDDKKYYKTFFVKIDYPPIQKGLVRLLIFNLSIPDKSHLQSNQLRGPPFLS